jgi:hypothetical protein
MGIGAMMTLLVGTAVFSRLIVVVFAPETCRHSIKNLKAAVIVPAEAGTAGNPAQGG